MAFSTIQGSGGAPDSFVGTPGVDSITITNLNKTVDLTALDSDDIINVDNNAGVVSGYSLRAGSGNDVITSGVVSGVTLAAGSFVNGNDGLDILQFNSFLDTSITASRVVGGKGNDVFNFTGAIENGSIVNGNKDDDTINTVGVSSSFVYGGKGADTINLTGDTVLGLVKGDDDNDTINVNGNINQSTINGNSGNDTITLAAALTSFTNSSVFGGAGNDDLIATNVGVDVRLYGDNGDDDILGSIVNDRLEGGAGVDELTGGIGNDKFLYGALADIATQTGLTVLTADTITDFISGDDSIVTDVAGSLTNFATQRTAGTFDDALIAANRNFILNSDLRYIYDQSGFLFIEAGSGGTAADAAINFDPLIPLVLQAADITV